MILICPVCGEGYKMYAGIQEHWCGIGTIDCYEAAKAKDKLFSYVGLTVAEAYDTTRID